MIKPAIQDFSTLYIFRNTGDITPIHSLYIMQNMEQHTIYKMINNILEYKHSKLYHYKGHLVLDNTWDNFLKQDLKPPYKTISHSLKMPKKDFTTNYKMVNIPTQIFGLS